MKAQRLAMLCVGAAPLILIGPARAEYEGLTIVPIANPYGLSVYRVYAVFDQPGQDEMIAVYGTPDVPLTLISNGSFYQHLFGTDTAPNEELIAAHPSLAFDTFVTIGVKSVGAPNGQPVDDTSFPPGWPGFGSGDVITTSSGWVVLPGSPQADPFSQSNSFAGTGRILIAQLSGKQQLIAEGRMMLLYRSNGVTEEREVAFIADYQRCLQITDCIDNPCFVTSFCFLEDDLCMLGGYPSPDCNGNFVKDACDIDFGTSLDLNANGVPDECDCLGGCEDGDGMVGITDFLALLGVWGQTGVPCDLDGGGVGITDFLALLAAWGPCP